MKKLIALIGFVLFVSPVFAQEQELCLDQEGYWEKGQCYEETFSCPKGYDEYEDTCRKWVEDITKDYKKPICPDWYHLHNEGNWSQLCHRDYNWVHPEHKSPTCPSGYSQDGVKCSKTIDNSYYDYTDKVSNEDGYCDEDIWHEPTYKECEEEPKPEPKRSEPENTFHKDKRCLAEQPETPQWAWKTPAEGGILATWSAMGGERVDIEVTNAVGEYEYQYYGLLNDGHEFLPNVGMSQLYRIRVYQDSCKKSDWLIDP